MVWWWTLWIISGIIGQFLFLYSIEVEAHEELTISIVVSVVSNIVGIPLALITIKVIRNYSDVEPLLNELKDDDESTTLNEVYNA